MKLSLSLGHATFLASTYDNMHVVLPPREAHMSVGAQTFYWDAIMQAYLIY